MEKDPFKEYIKESEPAKREKEYAWHTAIGLQAVDGLITLLKLFRDMERENIVFNSREFDSICKNYGRKIKNTCIVHQCTVYKETGKYFG